VRPGTSSSTSGTGDRKAEVDERLGELPVADAEGPVAGHAGEDSLAGLDDAQVVQARDVDALADQLDQFVDRLGLAPSERERERKRSPAAKAGGAAWPVELCEPPARAALAESQTAPRRTPFSTSGTRSFGDALEVEPLRQAARSSASSTIETFSSKWRSPSLPPR
jgi:hypothetical protein